MAQPSALRSPVAPLDITPADLEAFHKLHFSAPSLSHFGTHFLGPVPQDDLGEEEEEGEDDGLGYYPDSVKRTLTDEQIAMFRHSEIQALLRERRHAEENKASTTRERTRDTETEEGELEHNEHTSVLEPEQEVPAPKSKTHNGGGAAKRQRAEQRRKGKGYRQLSKPDLRKRTWDRVDHGLQSLDYGEEDAGAAGAPMAASQRRKISYEDV